MGKNGIEWLNNAVFYQIYPPSFYDSDSDGIGDIKGIIEKLVYIKELGCNALWINPCFESPFNDGGYDISDYYKVAPRYGTNNDMKDLFKESAKLDIKVCLDFVPGHTSINHKWFKESCKAEINKFTNWYIWTDSVREYNPPGFSTVNGYAERDGNYITNYFYCQPALNYGFANPDPDMPWQLPTNHPDIIALKKEMTDILRYWLDMGADGFRVDMPFSLIKNDKNWSQTMDLWQEIRKMFEKDYPEAVLISEWGSPLHAVKAGFHADFLLQFHNEGYTSLFRSECSLYSDIEGNSFFNKRGKGNITDFLDEFMEHHKKIKKDGYIALPSGNHDITRISLGRTEDEIKLAFVFLLTMPVIPFIYYGDEIGMNYIEELTSKEGGYQRTGSRTPMQWTKEKNAGFSKADKKELYLPVDYDENAPCVSEQTKHENSILNTVKKLLIIRNENPALQADGNFIPLYAEENKYPLVYLRTLGKKKVLIAINPSGKNATAHFKLPKADTLMELKMVNGIRYKENKGLVTIQMKELSYGIFYC
jgi:glycosidase